MRARANDETPMTVRDWLALAICVVVVILVMAELGPAIDRELAVGDARIEAHKASLVSQ